MVHNYLYFLLNVIWIIPIIIAFIIRSLKKEFKIKKLQKKIEYINQNLKKIKKINNQFHEFTDKNNKCTYQEKITANVINIIEFSLSKITFFLNELHMINNIRNIQEKKSKSPEFKKIFNKAIVEWKTIKETIKENKDFIFLESQNISKFLIFSNNLKSVFLNINKCIDNNKNNLFFQDFSIEFNKKYNEIKNIVEYSSKLQLYKGWNNHFLTNSKNIKKILNDFLFFIKNGLTLYSYIENNIEIPFKFIEDLVIKYSSFHQFFFNWQMLNSFIDETRSVIEEIKIKIHKTNFFDWIVTFKTKLENLSKKIIYKYIEIKKEIDSFEILKSNSELISKIIDLFDIQHWKNLKSDHQNAKYKLLINNFYEFYYQNLAYFKSKNKKNSSNISYFERLNNLNNILKKMCKIPFFQRQFKNNWNKKDKTAFKDKMTNMLIETFGLHDFKIPLNEEIIYYKNKFESLLEKQNINDEYELNLINQVIQKKIIVINIKYLVARHLIDNFNLLTKNKFQEKNIELINLIYQNKYDEIINKSLKLINNSKEK
ncbi:hypothetical protein [Mycoplasma sp. 2575]